MPGELICRIFTSPPRPLPPVGECPCQPPATGKLRGLNALSGLPHGITSYMRDQDLVRGPEYHAGARHGVVTVEAAPILHALKGVLLD